MSELCTIFGVGLLVLLGLLIGAAALMLFGLGAIVYGVILLPQQPLKGVVLIGVGAAIVALFSREHAGPLR